MWEGGALNLETGLVEVGQNSIAPPRGGRLQGAELCIAQQVVTGGTNNCLVLFIQKETPSNTPRGQMQALCCKHLPSGLQHPCALHGSCLQLTASTWSHCEVFEGYSARALPYHDSRSDKPINFTVATGWVVYTLWTLGRMYVQCKPVGHLLPECSV